MRVAIIALLAFIIPFSACRKNKPEVVEEQLPDAEIKVKTLTTGLSNVWEMYYGPDEYLWVTERSGKISRVNTETGEVTLVHTLSDVVSTGEGGLLGMTLHPQFSTNPWVYVVYNYGSPYREKVVRFTYSVNKFIDPLVIIDGIPAASIHNGSRLLITSDQKLLITTGDASVASNAQNMNSLAGKILRLNLDGSIPVDNPTAGSAVWTSGHRNPQGLTSANGRIYSSEHGPNNDDEINIIEKGRNYGWPNVEGLCNTISEQQFCNSKNVAEPIMTWTPTIATAGLIYYNADLLPQWKNSLLLVTLKGSRLVQLKLNSAGDKVVGSEEFFADNYGRLRAICQSPDGKVYMASSNGNNDKIIEIAK